MAPPAKKAKKSNEDPATSKPVVFTVHGLNTDVCLRVFDAEFHVHSMILKLHSAFFFKFLDSPNKTLPVTLAPGTFKNEWITKIDEDGSWSSVDARSIDKHDTQFDKFKGDRVKELVAFEKLLKAICGEEYKLLSVEELILMTDLADYYRALPALSKSLYRLLYDSYKEFNVSGCKRKLLPKLLDASYKLRFPDLFRECIILLVGKWDEDPSLYLRRHDPKIRKSIMAARHQIGNELAKANEKILHLSRDFPQLDSKIKMVKFTGNLPLPGYYRDLYIGYRGDECGYGNHKFLVEAALGPVLENYLRFSGSDKLSGGSPFEKYFLCATIDDDDLPWDRTQTDW